MNQKPNSMPDFELPVALKSRKTFTRVWWAYGLFGFVLALVLPAGREAYPTAVQMVAFGFTDLLPTTRRLVELTPFPGAMAVWWTVMLGGLPINILKAGFSIEMDKSAEYFLRVWNRSKLFLLLGVIGMPCMYFYLLIFGMGSFSPTTNSGHGKAAISALVNSKIGLSIFGSLLLAGVGITMGMIASHIQGAYCVIHASIQRRKSNV